ncbi:scramblase [Capsaspora owczarzaki ATCC 30864]|uniref:scramblase n=1 Tax=Capsaspora owczarzaki (strain ATCC 30864) TaxID=595528 RepID=UPI0003523A81|nr:scramblase [Capsaspora owczarzaki ATCC 30864]|eukprot:XP_004363731.2 scramblase [Capsaspora owczarzaki ATCC 30864]
MMLRHVVSRMSSAAAARSVMTCSATTTGRYALTSSSSWSSKPSLISQAPTRSVSTRRLPNDRTRMGGAQQHLLRQSRVLRPRKQQQQQQQQNAEAVEHTDAGIVESEQALDPALLGTGNEVLNSDSPSAPLLSHAGLIISRQIELANLLIGFEQANRYELRDPLGNQAGYLVEKKTFGTAIMRQILRLHRPFTALVLDTAGNPVLRLHRPFTLINSTVYVEDHEGRPIGFARQKWHLWRRKYELYLIDREHALVVAPDSQVKAEGLSLDMGNFGNRWSPTLPSYQWGDVDMGLWSWVFDVRDPNGKLLARIDKDFSGLMTEMFTDAHKYILKMDMLEAETPANELRDRPLYFDERAVSLACAVSIDFDFFSRHSGGGSGLGLFSLFALLSS